MLTRCPNQSQRNQRSQRQQRPQRSLLQRLWSLPQSLRRHLRRRGRPPGSKNKPKPPKSVPAPGATASRAPRASEG